MSTKTYDLACISDAGELVTLATDASAKEVNSIIDGMHNDPKWYGNSPIVVEHGTSLRDPANISGADWHHNI